MGRCLQSLKRLAVAKRDMKLRDQQRRTKYGNNQSRVCTTTKIKLIMMESKMEAQEEHNQKKEGNKGSNRL